ncbi:poly(A)-specific ribonuclease PNLDC1 [Patella vulgata]|uniref:poly(A)-specific ribonuclease PNLDC1 n=1 Tax=Patella vulgata TaxID=6465 RepID=UPI0021801BDB|nr:poly(A)-specific ribonuclease PNLDC1 [Patella vulgata]
MCEVLKSNFETLFPLIENAIKQCEFVALDTEFTGLQFDESCKASLFDTSEGRYLKLRRSFTQFTICQIGLSAFVNIKDNKYEAHTFNLYLFPHAFGPSDVRFMIQASSISFLTKHNFDFNKFVYEGVPYLNMEEELKLKEHISRKTMFSGLEREVDEEEIQCICSEIAEWFVRSKKHEIYKVENNSDTNKTNAYLLHTEIRTRFPDVWTHTDEADNIIVEHVTSSRRSELEDLDLDTRKQEEQKLVQAMLGFTRVFRLLQDYQKPIVGHNMLSDLMLVFDKFYKPLPEKFCDFKKELNTVLPRIYDTKHITFSAKKGLADHVVLDKTSLRKIYQILNSKEASEAVLFSLFILFI